MIIKTLKNEENPTGLIEAKELFEKMTPKVNTKEFENKIQRLEKALKDIELRLIREINTLSDQNNILIKDIIKLKESLKTSKITRKDVDELYIKGGVYEFNKPINVSSINHKGLKNGSLFYDSVNGQFKFIE